MNNQNDLEQLGRRDFARHLISRGLYASDVIKTLIVRYSIDEVAAWRLYQSAHDDIVRLGAELSPRDYVQSALRFWESIVRDPALPLDAKCSAQKAITDLVTDRKPKKWTKKPIGQADRQSELDARQACLKLGLTE